MFKCVMGVLCVTGLAAAASADIVVSNVSGQYLGMHPQGGGADADPNAIYSNVDTFGGSGFALGGSANQTGNQITRMLMDDATVMPSGPNDFVRFMRFAVYNGNTTPVSARARIRFWLADGAGGAPGTYFASTLANNTAGPIGFSFSPFTFGPGVTVLTGDLGLSSFKLPAGNYWFGITFDNNTGATGATAAQMDNMGMGLYNPPVVGSSADKYFATAAAGSFFAPNNPAGATADFGGNPIANFGWEMAVPAPGSLGLLGLAGVIASRRRR